MTSMETLLRIERLDGGIQVNLVSESGRLGQLDTTPSDLLEVVMRLSEADWRCGRIVLHITEIECDQISWERELRRK